MTNKKTDKACIRCCEPIDQKATYCKHCSGHQNETRNFLIYLASIIGLVTVVGSAGAFVVTSLPDIRKRFAWHDGISIHRFSTLEGIQGFNAGDGSIYISHLTLVWGPPAQSRQTIQPINLFVNAGAPFEKRWPTRRRAWVEIDLSDDRWTQLVKFAPLIGDEKACFVQAIEGETDPGVLMYRQHNGPHMREFPVTAGLTYYSLEKHDRKLNVSVDVTGILMSHEGCTDAPAPSQNGSAKTGKATTKGH